MENTDPSLQIYKACVLITEAGNAFGCSDVTTCKAMILCHHYRSKRKDWDEFCQLFATAAFHLSAQVCQEDLKMEAIVHFFDSLGAPPREQPCIEKLKERLMEVEYDIFKVVCGDYVESKKKRASKKTIDPLDTAHGFVCCYMEAFSSLPEIKQHIISVKTLSLMNVNTFYHCLKSISYTPLEIAWAAMFRAFQMFHIQVDKIKVINKEMSTAVQADRLQNAVDDMGLVVWIATKIRWSDH